MDYKEFQGRREEIERSLFDLYLLRLKDLYEQLGVRERAVLCSGLERLVTKEDSNFSKKSREVLVEQIIFRAQRHSILELREVAARFEPLQARVFRDQKGLSRREVSNIVGISEKYLVYLEEGKREIGLYPKVVCYLAWLYQEGYLEHSSLEKLS